MGIFEKLVRCDTAGEVERMLRGNDLVLVKPGLATALKEARAKAYVAGLEDAEAAVEKMVAGPDYAGREFFLEGFGRGKNKAIAHIRALKKKPKP